MNFYLPDFYNKFQLNYTIITLFQSHPEYFNENINIGAIYGSFPGMIWNGGRLNLDKQQCSNINFYLDSFNNLNIPIRFTLTNSLINYTHLNDKYCNYILDMANNGINEIIINSPILEDYLRNQYPNYKYILSTTKCERNIIKINDYCNEYNMVVIDYRDNNNWDFLKLLTQPTKIEILVNATCNPFCELRQFHYKLIAQQNLLPNEPIIKYLHNCPSLGTSFQDIFSFHTTVTNDLIPKYLELGINNFKLEGRNASVLNNIENYIYYLIKPEYQNEIKNLLIQNNYLN